MVIKCQSLTLTIERFILELDSDVRLLSFDVPNDDFAVIIDGNEVRSKRQQQMHVRFVVTGENFVYSSTALNRTSGIYAVVKLQITMMEDTVVLCFAYLKLKQKPRERPILSPYFSVITICFLLSTHQSLNLSNVYQ